MTEETLEATSSTEVTADTASTESVAEVSDVSFLDSLSEDLKSEPSLKDFKDVEGLAKSYVSAQKMIGNSIRIPSEDAGDEAREEFYKKLESVPGVARLPEEGNEEAINQFLTKLGRPENAADYKLEIPEDIPIDDGALNSFKELAHKVGLTSTQAKKLMEFEVGRAKAHTEASEEARIAAETALKEVWGNDYNTRLESAKIASNVFKEKYPDAMNELVNGPAGNNPALLAILSEVGKSMNEAGVVSGAAKLQFGVTAEEARERIEEVRMNRAHPYHNPTDPNHQAAVEKMHKLYNAAYPEE